MSTTPNNFLIHFIESHKDIVRDTTAKIVHDESNSIGLVRFVMDMFSTTMIDIANEFGISTYVFFRASAAMLGLTFHLHSLSNEESLDITKYRCAELLVSTYINSVHAKLFPSRFFDDYAWASFLNTVRSLRKIEEIMINTSMILDIILKEKISF